ncbi:MAG: hypothetical protein RL072_1527 [Actinomycetota bacterium]|jgi:SAM-dependent methyltransferase
MTDIVTDYDSAERRALAHLPNQAIQAFGAVTFASVGYPIRVHNSAELWRYIDVMHEGRFERNLALLKRVSDEELQLADWLAKGTFEYSTTQFSRPFTGRHCLTRALFQLRGIRRLKNECPGNKILELGPGSGYLSLLLAKTGYAVDTVEVAQAFVLHQSLFFNHFLPRESQVIRQRDNLTFTSLPAAGIRQVPWWIYADDTQATLDYDLITANHALAEFQPDSLGFLLRRFGKEHTERFGRSPTVLAESLGARMRPYEVVLQQFHEHGWTHQFDGSFYVFRFQPEHAREQLQNDLEERRYQQSFVRTLKRSVYLFLHERTKTNTPEKVGRAADTSIQTLRSIFDDLMPDEKTPDERYWSR